MVYLLCLTYPTLRWTIRLNVSRIYNILTETTTYFIYAWCNLNVCWYGTGFASHIPSRLWHFSAWKLTVFWVRWICQPLLSSDLDSFDFQTAMHYNLVFEKTVVDLYNDGEAHCTVTLTYHHWSTLSRQMRQQSVQSHISTTFLSLHVLKLSTVTESISSWSVRVSYPEIIWVIIWINLSHWYNLGQH